MAETNLSADGENVTTRRAKRTNITPKVRFEVFKRDKFTCQYCGRVAPEVVLNCDHVKPVAGGGKGDLLNLITSCRECNGGKGAVPLSDSSAIDKQRRMLDELEDRRQQIEMMVQWRDGLRQSKDTILEALIRAVSKTGNNGGITVSDSGVKTLKRHLRKYPFSELLQAIDEAFDTYFPENGTTDEWSKAFSKISVFADIARNEAERPYLRRLFYIQAILRNRTGVSEMLPFLEHCILAGADIEKMEKMARATNYISHFVDPYEAWLKERGKPFDKRAKL